MGKYLKATMDMPLILEANGSDNLYCYVDSVFAAHKDMKSQTGAGLTFRRGFAISVSTGQKLSPGSSMHAKLVVVSSILPKVQWV